MPAGGRRPGAGRKVGYRKPIDKEVMLRTVRPETYEKLRGSYERLEHGDLLTPGEVMQANMEFYHAEAHRILTAIFELPTLTKKGAQDARFEALKAVADHFRMRDKAQECARDLAKFIHRPMAALPVQSDEGKAKGKTGEDARVINVIPINPKVQEAFRRAAAGLPPEPRKVL